MKKLSMLVAMATLFVGVVAPAAFAAVPDLSWGTGGVATFTVPADVTVTDTAPLPDGGLVAVGYSSGFDPWGGVISADGSVLDALAGLMSPLTRFEAVATGNDRIYAVGSIEIGLGLSTIVAVFDTSGNFLESHTFVLHEFTEPTSAAVDAAGRLFVAGTGRGDDVGPDRAWVVRLVASGEVDAAFPTLFLEPPFPPFTDPVAYVGTSNGQAVAVVTGADDPAPGSSIGFHRVTETGSVFMADFSSARTIAAADIDSSSGHAVFGSLTPGASLTEVNYLIHSIDSTGVPAVTSAGSWIDVAGVLEVGRVRTGALLGAGEGDVNTFVDLVQTSAPFGSRSDSELVDVATSSVDGGVFVTSVDVPSGDLAITKFVGDDSGRFIDDDSSVHEADIERLDELGITRGCNPPINNLYCPLDDVTRGQMAAFLNRALALPSVTTDFFVDDNGSVFESDINAIAAVGITLGCNPPTNDRYCPNDPVTRGQMAAFLSRGFSLPASSTDFFVDDNGSVFEADINAIAMAGITLGCNPPTNDRYCPTDNVTRAQMASFIVRAVGGP